MDVESDYMHELSKSGIKRAKTRVSVGHYTQRREAVVSVVDGERYYREDFDKVEWSSNNIAKPPVSKTHSAHGEWLVSVVDVELDYLEDLDEGGVEQHQ